MNIRYLNLIAFIMSFSVAAAQQNTSQEKFEGKFTDARDNREYKWVLIGDQTWMAENLNISNVINARNGQISNNSIQIVCYEDDEVNCIEFGGLYSWDVIDQYIKTEGVRSICPEGWYLPYDRDWQVLVDYLGGEKVAGGSLKEAGTDHWDKPNTGATNSSGFSALGSGLFSTTAGGFINKGAACQYWTSSLNRLYSGENNTYITRILLKRNTSVTKGMGTKGDAYSVRCLKD
jgi:uncharacterized protein (TIGR02145 family)